MLKYSTLLFTILLSGGLVFKTAAQKQSMSPVQFQHPGLMQSQHDLDFMRTQVTTGKQPWADAYQRLLKEIKLDTPPHPFTHISQGAYGSDDQGGKALLNDANQAFNCALAWNISRKKGYAVQAIKILNAWSATLKDLDGNNAKLLAGLSGHYFLNAAEIIRYSQAGWRPQDINQFERFMLRVYAPLISDFFPEANGNWDAAMLNTMLDIGIFCNKRQLFDCAVHHYFRGNGNGAITKYIYPGGQPQEATRDWGHVQLGLGEFAKAARVAWTQGVDFYGAADNRLARGFEYAARFMTGDSVQAFGQISQAERKSMRDIYESIYNYYHNIRHFNMPYTLKMLKRTREKTAAELLAGLSMPEDTNGPFRQLPAPGETGRRVGPAPGLAAAPGVNVKVVKVGESLQQAIDDVGNTTHHILLDEGIYQLNAPLILRSGIKLEGRGLKTILMLAPNINGTVIRNEDAGLHDIVIANLTVEGWKSATEGKDPNDDRRQRSFQKATPRGGISLQSETGKIMQNITLLNLTVRHCTKNGILISGAKNVAIVNCDVTDNGAGVAPGPGQMHDLYMVDVSNGKVTGCRLDDSPNGSGLMLKNVSRMAISGNEMARNSQNGITGADSDALTISNNQVEGNNWSGIHLVQYATGCRNISIRKNTIWYNGSDKVAIDPH